MFKLPMFENQKPLELSQLREEALELRDKSIALFDKYQELQKEVQEFRLINKELTGLVFRLANNIYSLQTQIDDVKENLKGDSHSDIIEMVGEVGAK